MVKLNLIVVLLLNMEERLHTFWSTNILHKEFKQHQKVRDDLLEFVKDYKNKVPNGREGSENSNLYESKYDVTSFVERYPCLKELINFIGDGFKEVAYFSNKHIWEIQKINPSNVSAKITSLWFIDYLQDGFVFPHIHSGCSWSMVYYLLTPNTSKKDPYAGTHFLSPLNKADSNDLGNSYSRETSRNIIPSEGEGLFFPSTLVHSTYPNKNDDKKIIFSANCSFFEK